MRTQPAYGDKRDYRKIDLFIRRGINYGERRTYLVYAGSTTWSRTCTEAKARYLRKHPEYVCEGFNIVARFAK